MLKILMRTAVLVIVALSLGACNTVKGVGKDISKAGDKIEETAEKHD